MKTIVKMDDLKERLKKHGYLLFNYQRQWKVAVGESRFAPQTTEDFFTCTTIFKGDSKRDIENWLDGYENGLNDAEDASEDNQ